MDIQGHDYLQGFEAVEAVEVARDVRSNDETYVANWTWEQRTGDARKRTEGHNNANLHEVALEEFFQLPLGCRIREVADVQSAALGSTGMDGILVLVLTSDGGIAKSVGDVLDSVGNFLHGGGHLDQWLLVEMGD